MNIAAGGDDLIAQIIVGDNPHVTLIGILDKNRAASVLLHHQGRLLNRGLRVAKHDVRLKHTGHRLVEKRRRVVFGLDALDDNGRIGFVQHALAEGVGKILAEMLVGFAQIEKHLFGQQINISVFYGPQGAHGQTTVEQYGNAAENITFSQFAF